MKFRTIWIFLVLLVFNTVPPILAQSLNLTDAALETVVITMRQERSKSFGRKIYPYLITIAGNGKISYQGEAIDQAIAQENTVGESNKQRLVKKESPLKVIRVGALTKAQIRDLVDEFYRIDFFSLKDRYYLRDNGDGTSLIIEDAGLATVITSITINGKTKSVTNENFAPNKLIELQRKIYRISNVARFVKEPPYWFTKFPDEQFPKSIL